MIDRVKKGDELRRRVAQQVSTDTGSAAQGGLLMCQVDSAQWSQLDATFRAGAEATPVGTLSAPVQTQFGYHVIEVLDLTRENARRWSRPRRSPADPLEPVLGQVLQAGEDHGRTPASASSSVRRRRSRSTRRRRRRSEQPARPRPPSTTQAATAPTQATTERTSTTSTP